MTATPVASSGHARRSRMRPPDPAQPPLPTGLQPGQRSTDAPLSCSVVVPVYNGAAVILRCLNALATQQPPDPTLEIIIVDDGSTDGTAAALEVWRAAHPHVRLQIYRQVNAGPAAARNQGARLATGELLLLTDADCIPSAGWVQAFRSAFAGANPPDAAMGAYTSAQQTPAARFSQLEFEERYTLMQRRATIDFVATYSAAYRCSAFLEAGGFDGAFRQANNEDVELSYRLAALGKRLVFVPAATVEHEHDATWADYLHTKTGRGYWRVLVYRRFPGKGIKDSYTPQLMKAQMPLALLALLSLGAALLGRTPRRLAGALPFLLSTVPMLRFALQQPNPALRAAAPWVVWGSLVRALAFVLGVAKALLQGGSLATQRDGALAPARNEAAP